MKTRHTIYFGASQQLSAIKDASVDLVVTSPPYPMIEMWDDILSSQNPSIASALQQGRTADAFELMHQELNLIRCEACYLNESCNKINCIFGNKKKSSERNDAQ